MDSIQGPKSLPKQDTALNICAISFLRNICPRQTVYKDPAELA